MPPRRLLRPGHPRSAWGSSPTWISHLSTGARRCRVRQAVWTLHPLPHFGCNVPVEAGVGEIRGSAWFGWGPIGPGCGLTHQAPGTTDGSLHLSFGGGTVFGRRPAGRRCGCTCSPPRPPGGGADTLLGGKTRSAGRGGRNPTGPLGRRRTGHPRPGVDHRGGPSDALRTDRLWIGVDQGGQADDPDGGDLEDDDPLDVGTERGCDRRDSHHYGDYHCQAPVESPTADADDPERTIGGQGQNGEDGTGDHQNSTAADVKGEIGQ